MKVSDAGDGMTLAIEVEPAEVDAMVARLEGEPSRVWVEKVWPALLTAINGSGLTWQEAAYCMVKQAVAATTTALGARPRSMDEVLASKVAMAVFEAGQPLAGHAIAACVAAERVNEAMTPGPAGCAGSA